MRGTLAPFLLPLCSGGKPLKNRKMGVELPLQPFGQSPTFPGKAREAFRQMNAVNRSRPDRWKADIFV